MSVIEITSKAQFDELIKKTPYVALQAHAVWCGPCKAISPFFTKFAASLSVPEKYTFARFDTDEVPDLAFELGVRSIPAFFFFENGDKTEDLTAPKPPALQKVIEDLSTKAKAKAGGGGDAVSATTTTAAAAAADDDGGAHL
uniref:Thioredoxin n=1 Tax=Beauveria bassiana TaxID=176275 RepID=C7DY69_BEABA|nr:thioredoxin [Beauveria bassiana]